MRKYEFILKYMFKYCSTMLKPTGGTGHIIACINSVQNLTPTSRQRPLLYCMYQSNVLHNMLCNTCSTWNTVVLFSWSISGARVVHCAAGNLMSYICSPWSEMPLICFSPSVCKSLKPEKKGHLKYLKRGLSRGFPRWSAVQTAGIAHCERVTRMCCKGGHMYSISRTSSEPL